MRVDDLSGDGRPHSNVARDASVLPVGRRAGEMLLAISVAVDAERGLLDRAETEAMVVVVARRAQAATHRPGGRITDERPPRPRGRGEPIAAERHSRGPVTVERALEAAREVLAGQRLLKLGLVAARALAVPDRLPELGMAPGRVALPTTNAPGFMTTPGVVRQGRRSMAGYTVFDVDGGPRDRLRVRSRGPGYQEASGDRKTERGHQETSGELGHARLLRDGRALTRDLEHAVDRQAASAETRSSQPAAAVSSVSTAKIGSPLIATEGRPSTPTGTSPTSVIR